MSSLEKYVEKVKKETEGFSSILLTIIPFYNTM